MRAAAIVIALICLVVACVYWLVPAGSLPAFLPGFEAGSPRIHYKHGGVALAVAVVLFVVAWFAGRSRA